VGKDEEPYIKPIT